MAVQIVEDQKEGLLVIVKHLNLALEPLSFGLAFLVVPPVPVTPLQFQPKALILDLQLCRFTPESNGVLLQLVILCLPRTQPLLQRPDGITSLVDPGISLRGH